MLNILVRVVEYRQQCDVINELLYPTLHKTCVYWLPIRS